MRGCRQTVSLVESIGAAFATFLDRHGHLFRTRPGTTRSWRGAICADWRKRRTHLRIDVRRG
jgi:hypothetical protein